MQTDDDLSGGRVTEAIGATTEGYWSETQWMYLDVLNRYPKLGKEYRNAPRSGVRLPNSGSPNLRIGERTTGAPSI